MPHLVAVLLFLVSACGLLWPGLCRDSDWVRVQFRAWDLLGLAVILPVLVLSHS